MVGRVTAQTLLLRFRVGINDVACLLIGRCQYGLVAHAAPRIEVSGAGNAVILHW
jgi:hypothetical protein